MGTSNDAARRAARKRAKGDVQLSATGVAPSHPAVIVTGGARGLGRAMTLGLAKAGVAVAVAELPSSRAEIGELVELARAQGLSDKIHAVDCDVTRWEDCRAAVDKAAARFGAVHARVNNARHGVEPHS